MITDSRTNPSMLIIDSRDEQRYRARFQFYHQSAILENIFIQWFLERIGNIDINKYLLIFGRELD